jgi:hypothetical protein
VGTLSLGRRALDVFLAIDWVPDCVWNRALHIVQFKFWTSTGRFTRDILSKNSEIS